MNTRVDGGGEGRKGEIKETGRGKKGAMLGREREREREEGETR